MKNYLTLLLIFTFSFINAQTTKGVEDTQLAINLVLPGAVYEVGVSESDTFVSELTVGFAYRESSFFGNGFGIYPIGRLQYRDYYNLERRLEKNKRIAGNSGNYTAPTIAYQSGNALIGDLDFSSNYYLAVGVVYGIQRTAPKGFQFRLEAGPAYSFSQNENGFGIMIAAKIAWVVSKKK